MDINKKYFIILLIPFFVLAHSWAQGDKNLPQDTIETEGHEEFLRVIENTLSDYYQEFSNNNQSQIDSILAAFGHDNDFVPEFSDEVYCSRLEGINKITPFDFSCNEVVLSSVKTFAMKKRSFTSVVLGRSKLYFNMFEEKLAKYDLPIELKYLAVIESGLRPQIKSRAGALGLWQFMFRTGKMYGLEQNSYLDERMDPELATEAACAYLKKLHNLYNDWYLALAAYNAGPGNVNKAIRRSGGKMTYWEIRPYLPRETRQYVPNFISMAYMLTYHAEHNITAREPKFHDFEIDTVCLKDGLHMAVIDSLIGWSVDDIKMLNPIYKSDFIPALEKHKCIQIPKTYVDNWIAFEDSIYVLDSTIYHSKFKEEKETIESSYIVHAVKSGQTLGHIAKRYGTTVNNLMAWNNLNSTRLSIGQKIRIYQKTLVAKKEETPAQPTKTTNNNTNSNTLVHTVNSGDSLWTIAVKNETTVEELQKLNPNINYKNLKIGQQIRVR